MWDVSCLFMFYHKNRRRKKNEYELNAKRHNVKAAHDQSAHETEETRQKQ